MLTLNDTTKYTLKQVVVNYQETGIISYFLGMLPWHYESRVKTLNSFALKAETGRYKKVSELEDFFGACLVVENSSSIAYAIKLIESKFKVAYKRPKQQNYTHKDPDSFVFDDLRLYLMIPKNPDQRPKGIEEVIFELQLKTFLQHAWSIATHQLIYKGDNLSWASNRIAFQVKAMLEHAELSIMESDKLTENYLVNKTNKIFTVHKQLVSFFKERWKEEQLPNDLIRLASNVRELMKVTEINLQELKDICRESRFIGKKPLLNISPQVAITLAIIECKDGVIERLRKKSRNIFLPNEGISLLSEDNRREVESICLKPE